MVPVEIIVKAIAAFLFLSFWVTSFVILYHLARFGVGVMPKKLAAFFLIGALSLFAWSIVAFTTLDIGTIKL